MVSDFIEFVVFELWCCGWFCEVYMLREILCECVYGVGFCVVEIYFVVCFCGGCVFDVVVELECL